MQGNVFLSQCFDNNVQEEEYVLCKTAASITVFIL